MWEENTHSSIKKQHHTSNQEESSYSPISAAECAEAHSKDSYPPPEQNATPISVFTHLLALIPKSYQTLIPLLPAHSLLSTFTSPSRNQESWEGNVLCESDNHKVGILAFVFFVKRVLHERRKRGSDRVL